MTALTIPARPGHDASPRPVPWRRMAWVTWRQHRIALTGVAALLGLLAVYLWIVGHQLHRAYGAALACRPGGSIACAELIQRFNGMDGFLSNGVILHVVPALIGVFVGVPVLARELETGTFRFAWTQGFGRTRWTVAKLTSLAVVLTAAAGALSVLFSWYYQPYFNPGNPALNLSEMSQFFPGLFDLRGVGFAAWTLAVFAIGAFAGTLIRRVVPAMAATLAVYAGLAFAAALYLRQHYLTPLLTSNLNLPGSAWVIGQQWRTKGGQPVSQSVLGQVLQGAPPPVAGKGGVPKSFDATQYLIQHGYTQWTSYQPGSRFWAFQLIEGGWLLALSLLLMAATVWLVRRRVV